MKLYKVLDHDGRCISGGTGSWSLPHEGQPGEWMPERAGIQAYSRGYRLADDSALLEWPGPLAYEAEGRGEHAAEGSGLHVFSSARLLRRVESWNEATLRRLALQFARRALAVFPVPAPLRSELAAILDLVERGALDEAREAARPVLSQVSVGYPILGSNSTNPAKERQAFGLHAVANAGEACTDDEPWRAMKAAARACRNAAVWAPDGRTELATRVWQLAQLRKEIFGR